MTLPYILFPNPQNNLDSQEKFHYNVMDYGNL